MVERRWRVAGIRVVASSSEQYRSEPIDGGGSGGSRARANLRGASLVVRCSFRDTISRLLFALVPSIASDAA